MNEASPWLCRWAHLIPRHGSVLDVAAGRGRHARWLAERGHAVTAVDRDGDALAALAPTIERVVADLEVGPWPLAERKFDAIVVFNYLWRPLFPRLLDALAPGGALLVETFARGQEAVGRPRRPEFLLERAELLGLATGLRIVAFEDGFVDAPARFVQRLAAVRAGGGDAAPLYRLAPEPTDRGALESADSSPTS